MNRQAEGAAAVEALARAAGVMPPGPVGRVLCLADVAPMTVRYLWALRIPRGALTGLIGDPGVGKSSTLAAIGAAVTRGFGLPDEMAQSEAGGVLVLSAEDHVAAVIRPRMGALGADLTRVHVLDGPLCLADDAGRAELEAAMQDLRPDLVTVDPVQSYMGGGIDLHRANEVRSVLAPLADLAERYDAAIMLAGHLTKATGGKALYRALGSVDFAAAVRSLLLAGADPDDDDERAIVHVKSNYGPLAAPIGYDLRAGVFEWTATHLTAAAVLALPEAQASRLEDCEDFLRQALADGARPVKDLESEAKAAGLSWDTIRNKAKPRTGIVAGRVGGVGPAGWWEWRLPDGGDNPPKRSKGAAGALSAQGTDSTPARVSAPGLPLDGCTKVDALSSNGHVPAWTCLCGKANTGGECWNCHAPQPADVSFIAPAPWGD